MTKANHLSKTAEWFTPPDIVELARRVLGGFDLDPASCAKANEVVRATRYYTKEDDGLEQPWEGRVFLNPPGDLSGNLVKRFWAKAVGHWEGMRSPVFWVGFNIEQLRSLQLPMTPSPLGFPTCVPPTRLRFRRPDGSVGTHPSHANYITVIADYDSDHAARFADACRDRGWRIS